MDDNLNMLIVFVMVMELQILAQVFLPIEPA